jgi:D-cysteine desulfhydrase
VRSLAALAPNLWLKDEGACSPVYGGNKVRKLEFLLAAAGEHVVTVGAEGSHHVLATALFAHQLGKRVTALCLPRPPSAHAARVQAVSERFATCVHLPDTTGEGAHLAALTGAGATYIPAGGSNALGALGWEAAGVELAEQVRAGLLPEPQRIWIPLGTAATAAGLATGLRRAGLRSEVVGVRVVPEFVTPAARVHELGGPVTIDDRWLGEGYGVPTPEALAAVERARAVGLELETTYSGKALAAALAAEGGPNLWWNTLSTVPLPGAP